MCEVVRASLLETRSGPRAGSLWTSWQLLLQDDAPGTLQGKGRYPCQVWQLPCSWLCKRRVIDSRSVGRLSQGAWRQTLGKTAARGRVLLPAQSRRLGSRELAVCGGGRGRGQLRGRGSGRQGAASGCRSAALSACLSAGRPSWALGLQCGTKRGRWGCMGRESNPGLPRGRREFYH